MKRRNKYLQLRILMMSQDPKITLTQVASKIVLARSGRQASLPHLSNHMRAYLKFDPTFYAMVVRAIDEILVERLI
jgi:hypothetical protein